MRKVSQFSDNEFNLQLDMGLIYYIDIEGE